MSYIADDRNTAFNEANTMGTIAGEKISLGELLGSGSAMKAAAASDGMPGEFVKSAVEVLMDLLTEAELYAKYQAVATDEAGRSAFDGRLNNIAERAQGAVDMIFGTNATDGDVVKKVNIITDGTLPIEDTDTTTDGFRLSNTDYIRATQTVRGLNRLLDAPAPPIPVLVVQPRSFCCASTQTRRAHEPRALASPSTSFTPSA